MNFPKKKYLLLIVTILLVFGGGVYIAILFHNNSSVERVVIITIDTLRADHLGAYGYIRNTSPFFDNLAKQGILFKNTLVSMPVTAPSHASLFTSLYPIQHGVLKNGHKLKYDFLTMAEIFQQMGYRTAGVVSIGMFKSAKLHQGFEYFDGPSFSYAKTHLYRPAKDTINAAKEWLKTINPNEKFFLWIHLFDPHTPLHPPKAYYDKLVASSDRGTFINFLINKHGVTENYFINQEKMFERITMYDAEIHYVDTELQRLFQYYEQKDFDTKSIWVITADHGEGAGSHGWWSHGKHLYNEQLRVPLLFYFSPGGGNGQTVEQITENIDVFPTIIELAKGSVPVDHIEGESLLPLMFPQRQRGYKKVYAFGQRRLYTKIHQSINPKTTDYEAGEKYAIQSQQYKYIYRTAAPDEFYDLRADPYELKNLINHGLDEEVRFRDVLLLKLAELTQKASLASETVDKETIDQLRALGYVQ